MFCPVFGSLILTLEIPCFESVLGIVHLSELQWMTSEWKLMETVSCCIRSLLEFFCRRPVTMTI